MMPSIPAKPRFGALVKFPYHPPERGETDSPDNFEQVLSRDNLEQRRQGFQFYNRLASAYSSPVATGPAKKIRFTPLTIRDVRSLELEPISTQNPNRILFTVDDRGFPKDPTVVIDNVYPTRINDVDVHDAIKELKWRKNPAPINRLILTLQDTSPDQTNILRSILAAGDKADLYDNFKRFYKFLGARNPFITPR